MEYEPHPTAALFPMLPPDELQEMAEDIKANGQQLPILIKGNQIIDGRNRLAACQLAQVPPVFEDFNGVDPDAFIVSANINRRHMTKGQRAMALATIYPEPKRGVHANSELKKLTGNDGTLQVYLSYARAVLKYSPTLVDDVMSNKKKLPEAYELAKAIKNSSETATVRLENIREKYPDVASQVDDGSLTMEGAEAETMARDELERQRVAGLNAALDSINAAYRFLETEKLQSELTSFIADSGDSVKFIGGGQREAKQLIFFLKKALANVKT